MLYFSDSTRWITCRWYASWILLIAWIPIVIMYVIWISNTFNDKIISEEHLFINQDENERLMPKLTIISRIESDFSLYLEDGDIEMSVNNIRKSRPVLLLAPV